MALCRAHPSMGKKRKGGTRINEVFLEGVTVSIAKLTHPTTTSHHLIIRLQKTHRNRQGQRKHEVYTVNAWNRLADWADKHLAAGVPVLVRGYLTQQTHDGVTATENHGQSVHHQAGRSTRGRTPGRLAR